MAPRRSGARPAPFGRPPESGGILRKQERLDEALPLLSRRAGSRSREPPPARRHGPCAVRPWPVRGGSPKPRPALALAPGLESVRDHARLRAVASGGGQGIVERATAMSRRKRGRERGRQPSRKPAKRTASASASLPSAPGSWFARRETWPPWPSPRSRSAATSPPCPPGSSGTTGSSPGRSRSGTGTACGASGSHPRRSRTRGITGRWSTRASGWSTSCGASPRPAITPSTSSCTRPTPCSCGAWPNGWPFPARGSSPRYSRSTPCTWSRSPGSSSARTCSRACATSRPSWPGCASRTSRKRGGEGGITSWRWRCSRPGCCASPSW